MRRHESVDLFRDELDQDAAEAERVLARDFTEPGRRPGE